MSGEDGLEFRDYPCSIAQLRELYGSSVLPECNEALCPVFDLWRELGESVQSVFGRLNGRAIQLADYDEMSDPDGSITFRATDSGNPCRGMLMFDRGCLEYIQLRAYIPFDLSISGDLECYSEVCCAVFFQHVRAIMQDHDSEVSARFKIATIIPDARRVLDKGARCVDIALGHVELVAAMRNSSSIARIAMRGDAMKRHISCSWAAPDES